STGSFSRSGSSSSSGQRARIHQRGLVIEPAIEQEPYRRRRASHEDIVSGRFLSKLPLKSDTVPVVTIQRSDLRLTGQVKTDRAADGEAAPVAWLRQEEMPRGCFRASSARGCSLPAPLLPARRSRGRSFLGSG